MDELSPAPPVPQLVTQAYALARQVGFPLTRQEAEQGDHGARPGLASPSASLPGVGRFLAVLAAGCHGGRIGEIGTGVGIGTAWMAGAMPADCTLVTVEIDARRAAAAAQLLASDRRIRVLKGDARELLPPCGPFDLLFADGGWRDPAGLSALVDLLRIGGRLVMDDVTPQLAGGSGGSSPRAGTAGGSGGSSPRASTAGGSGPSGSGVSPGSAVSPQASTASADAPPQDDVKRALFFGDPRLFSTEVVLPDLRNSLLVGTRIS